MVYFVGDTILLTRLSILSSAFHLFHQYLTTPTELRLMQLEVEKG